MHTHSQTYTQTSSSRRWKSRNLLKAAFEVLPYEDMDVAKATHTAQAFAYGHKHSSSNEVKEEAFFSQSAICLLPLLGHFLFSSSSSDLRS